jgi:hypothetical protein
MSAFSNPWSTCNNCKQPFQGQLSVDLASACVSFAEATYGHPDSCKWDKLKVMAAQRLKIMALSDMHGTDTTNEAVKVEMTFLINQLLDAVKQTKKDYTMNRWVHMPKDSEEYHYYRALCGDYEACAYSSLGALSISDTSEKGFNIMITHYKKARAIYNLIGLKDRSNHLDTMISMFTEIHAANDLDALSTATNSGVGVAKNRYERLLNSGGMNSERTMRSGLNYARILRRVKHHIDAERLAIKVATASRQVHGPHHNFTIEADELLKKCMERFVIVLPEMDQVFLALRYENDGEVCVVKGPITEPRQVDDEWTHHVESNLIVPAEGCAVICHGLVSASHLNGRLGDVRDMKKSGTGIRLAVHFEKKKGEKSALVKP